MKEFIKVLNRKSYQYEEKDGEVVVLHQGSVYLSSLTTLPENIKFENQGSVYLNSLTTLPENIKFENQGSVYLRSMNNKPIKYRGKNFVIRIIDGETMLCKTHREADGFKITKALYLKGGEIKNLPPCFIAEKDGFFAHGETLKSAVEDVNFKYLQKNLNKKELVAQIKKRGTVTKNDYRLLTGSCQMGVNMFCKELGIDVDELPISKVLELTEGRYGHSTFKELLGNQ